MISLLKELVNQVNQVDLAKADGSDAGSTDVKGKGAEVRFDLMRNTINSDGKISGSDVANYLERAHELNDEVETVLYGLETSDGKVVKVYVNAQQAEAFEAEMKKMLGMEDDIEEAINNLATKFDIVDVVWPKGESDEEKDDALSLDDTASLGNPEDEDEDDDLDVIASMDDDGAPPVTDETGDEEGEGDEEGGDKPKKKKKADGEEEEGAAEPKKDKPKKDKHSLLKSIGGGLAGKEVKEEVVHVDFTKGKGVAAPDVVAPHGYDRFELDGRNIIGIKGDKGTVVSTVSDERLGQELVRVYNGGKASTTLKPLSLLAAFGTHGINVLNDLGIKLMEKPDYWEDLEEGGYGWKYAVDDLKLKKAEKALGGLPTYTDLELFGKHPRGPLATLKMQPPETTFIVKLSDGRRFLVDRTGASSYIRMWAPIVDAVKEGAAEEATSWSILLHPDKSEDEDTAASGKKITAGLRQLGSVKLLHILDEKEGGGYEWKLTTKKPISEDDIWDSLPDDITWGGNIQAQAT